MESPNAGKIDDLGGMCKKLGISDGDLALMKVDALTKIVQSIQQSVGVAIPKGEDLGDDYNPGTIGQLIECVIHKQLKEKMDAVVEGIDNSLLK